MQRNVLGMIDVNSGGFTCIDLIYLSTHEFTSNFPNFSKLYITIENYSLYITTTSNMIQRHDGCDRAWLRARPIHKLTKQSTFSSTKAAFCNYEVYCSVFFKYCCNKFEVLVAYETVNQSWTQRIKRPPSWWYQKLYFMPKLLTVAPYLSHCHILWTHVKTTVKLLAYASPAWWGYVSADDRHRLDRQNWVTDLTVRQLLPASVMTPTINSLIS